MSDSVRPHRRQPIRLPCPWDSPGKNTAVGCHFLLQSMKVKSESEVAQSCPTLTPWTAAYQAPPSMGFSRQEYWSGVPLPSPIHLWVQVNQRGKFNNVTTSMLVLESWWHEQPFLLDICLIVEAQCIWTPFNRFIVPCGDWGHEIKRRLLLERKVMTNLDSNIKKQRHYFVNKGPSSQGYCFSSGGVWMWELDYKESWVPKDWCFWTVVLEKTLESPLDCKEIQPVHPKGDQSWVFIGGTDVEAETPILWPPDAKSWLIWKDPDAGKDWRWEEKGMTEDEIVGWHHWFNGHEFE